MTSAEHGGGGVELAKGYITLSIKYAGAMSQVDNDFNKIEEKAVASGKSAGTAMGKELTTGVAAATTAGVSSALKPIETQAIKTGKDAGMAMGKEMASAVSVAVKDPVVKALKPIETEAAKTGDTAGTTMGKHMSSGIESSVKADGGKALKPLETHAVVAGDSAGAAIGQTLVSSLADEVGVHLPTKFVSAFDSSMKKAQTGLKLTGRETGTVILGAVASGIAGVSQSVSGKSRAIEDVGRTLGNQFTTGIAMGLGANAPRHISGAVDNAMEMARTGVALRGKELGLVLSHAVVGGIGTGVGTIVESALSAAGKTTPLSAGRTAAAADRELLAAKASGDNARIKKAQEAALKAHAAHEDVLQNFSPGKDLGAGIERMAGKAKDSLVSLGSVGAGAIAKLAGPILGLVSGPMAALVAGLGSAAGIGLTLKAGFDKASALDSIRTKMEVLGRSASQVQFLVNSAGQAVKGTTFELTDMLGVAQSALDAGGSEGLTKYLRTVADTSTVTGQSVEKTDEMLGKFRKDGMATVETLADISKSGLPISKWLAQDLHKSDDEFKAFVTQHGVTYQALMDSIERHTHSGAARINHTFDAQMKIMGKNISNIGQALVAPFIGVGVGPFEGLNHQLEKFTGWLEAHQPEIVGFFTNVAVAVEKMVAKALIGFSKLTGGLANILMGLSHIPGLSLLIGDEGISGLRDASEALKGSEKEIRSWAESILTTAIPATMSWGDHMKLTTSFNQALKDKVDETKIAFTELNAAGGVEIRDATPGIIENLTKLKIHLKQLGSDPTHLEIIPDTPEAIQLINDMREKEGREPIKIPVQPKLDPNAMLGALAAAGAMAAANPIKFTVTLGELSEHDRARLGFQPPATPPGGPPAVPGMSEHDRERLGWPPAPRAYGGIDGRLPGSAIIQPAVPGGLVQWAEPATGGEAYIPLATSKRQRSIAIWRETGKMLGVGWSSGADGDNARFPGQRGNSYMYPNMGGQIDLPGGRWITDSSGRERYSVPAMFGGIFDDGAITVPGGNLDAAHTFLSTITGGKPGSVRSKYNLGGFSPSSIDCSGLVSSVINAYLGLGPFSSRMSTSGEESWLKAKGFKMGMGPPGSLRVGWYDHGGGAAGHTALTLPDGTNAESTTSHGISGARVGPLAAGADSSQFTSHAYLPMSTGGLPGTGGAGGRGPGGGLRVSPAGFGDGDGTGGGGSGAGGPAGADSGYSGIGPGGVDLGVKSAGSNPYYAAGAAAGAGAATAGAVAGGAAVAGGGEGSDPLGQLADIGVGGLTESLLPPGFINPMTTPVMKSAAALMNFLGGRIPGGGGKALSLAGAALGGSGSGVVSALRGFTTPEGTDMSPGSPGAAPAAGSQPSGSLKRVDSPGGGAPAIDASVHYHGDVNGDMGKFTDMHQNMVTAQDRAITNFDAPRLGENA